MNCAVSELCKNLDPIIERLAQVTSILFLLVDAMYLKGREDGNGSYVFSQTENLLSPRLGALLMEQDENGRIF